MPFRPILASIFVTAGLSAHAAEFKIDLDGPAFGRVLGRLALQDRSCHDLQKQLHEIQHRQNEMAEVLRKNDKTAPFDLLDSMVIWATGPMVTRGLMLHSLPLISGAKEEYRGQAVINLLRFYANEAAQGRREANLVQDASLSETITNVKTNLEPHEYLETYGEPFKSTLDKYESIANPLALWLIAQPPRSVEPLKLVEQAMVYAHGDVLEALGTLGQMFDQERMNISGARRTLAVLGSRVKPFYSGHAVNPIGINYHFWSYLNMNVIHVETTAKLFSWAYEKEHQGDLEEYNADKAGIAAGSALHELIKNRYECNQLKEKLSQH